MNWLMKMSKTLEENAIESSSSHRPKPRLAVVVSHPIQYYAPYYRAIAAAGRVDIKAFFCSRIGLNPILDPLMGVEIAWKADLLGGYEHEFLPEADSIIKTGFSEVNNPSITSRLEAYRPNVILVHGYASKTLLRAIFWARGNGVPVMNISDRSLFGLTTPLRQAARRVVLPLILKQYSAFLCLGDAVEEFYRTFGAKQEQIFRVPNMLDESFWAFRDKKSQARAEMRATLGLTDDDFAVLYVGKFIPLKRVQDLVEAAERLEKRRASKRRVHIIFAGDGMMRAELEARAKAQNLPTHFLGFINIDNLPRYYCAADALAHPSENESFGIIALEASIYGLPLIISDRVGAVGPTSIARPDENAIIYRCADVEALSEALERLANEPETCARMSEASLRFSQDHDGRMSVENTMRAVDFCLANSRKAKI